MPRPVNALLVDDEPHVRLLIKTLLKQLGITTVWEAGDGTTALELAGAHKPNVVLLDINLPQMGGLQVLAKLKAAHPDVAVKPLAAIKNDAEIAAEVADYNDFIEGK